MPHTVTLNVLPNDIRAGDDVGINVIVLNSGRIVTKGQHKGEIEILVRRVKAQTGNTVDEHRTYYDDVEVPIRREVPTAEERDEYLTALAVSRKVTEVLEARDMLNRDAQSLAKRAQALVAQPYGHVASGGGVLSRNASDVDYRAGVYNALFRAYARELESHGIESHEAVQDMLLKNYGTHVDCPVKRPRNLDCGPSGVPDPSQAR